MKHFERDIRKSPLIEYAIIVSPETNREMKLRNHQELIHYAYIIPNAMEI